ncbi:MAG: ATPase domain-containing protein [Candidatus Micrarchaeia archaeon]
MIRVKTGIPGLDRALNGGLIGSRCMHIVGTVGTGKSILAAQFLYMGAVEYGEPGVYLSLDEKPERIKENMLEFGWDFEKLERQNRLRVDFFTPLEVQQYARQESIAITNMIRSVNAKRFVVDTVSTFSLMFRGDYEKRLYISKLVDEILKKGCTLLLLSDAPYEQKPSIIDVLADGLITLRIKEKGKKLVRTLEIVKMRGTLHLTGELPMEITTKGISVRPRPI